jgi:hypothetical protein
VQLVLFSWLGSKDPTLSGAGEVASGVFYLEVSLALVGVASPAYSNNRISCSEKQVISVIFGSMLHICDETHIKTTESRIIRLRCFPALNFDARPILQYLDRRADVLVAVALGNGRLKHLASQGG